MRRLAVAATLAGLAASACAAAPASRTVRVEMRYSRFVPASLSIPAGTTVRFELVNADPIAHEFVLGTEQEQRTHERAPDRVHDERPGQASLAPGETKTIEFTFGTPGTLIYGCHRPGHYSYGMRGAVRVR